MAAITQIILEKKDRHPIIRFYPKYNSETKIFTDQMVKEGWCVREQDFEIPTYDGDEQKLASFMEGFAYSFYEMGIKCGENDE